MNSKEPDENEKEKNGDGVFNSLAGVSIFGMACCIAGPTAVLAGIGGLKAWFNGLHPFVIALFVIVAGLLVAVWATRRNCRRDLSRGKLLRPNTNNITSDETWPGSPEN